VLRVVVCVGVVEIVVGVLEGLGVSVVFWFWVFVWVCEVLGVLGLVVGVVFVVDVFGFFSLDGEFVDVVLLVCGVWCCLLIICGYVLVWLFFI